MATIYSNCKTRSRYAKQTGRMVVIETQSWHEVRYVEDIGLVCVFCAKSIDWNEED